MTDDRRVGEFEALNAAQRDRWDRNAEWWDAHAGNGKLEFQRVLVGPATDRLLELRPDEVVLDVGCGTGAGARAMAERGVRVVAIDFSAPMIELAKQRTPVAADRIEYQVVDVTDVGQLLALGRRRFDAAVCSMALMDIAAIDPLAAGLAHILREHGRFVFSVSHPCFNGVGSVKIAEEENRDGRLVVTRAVKIVEYLGAEPRPGVVGPPGQPTPHYYFDRPLGVLFGAFFRHGFVLDMLEEPAFARDAGDGGLSWRNYPEIPPVLVARLRLG